MFLEMNMDRVRPIESTLELPNLRSIAFDPETNIRAIKNLIVDYPLSIITVKLEATPDSLRYSGWHLVERWVGSRIDAVVRYSIGNHTELKHLVALSGWRNGVAVSG